MIYNKTTDDIISDIQDFNDKFQVWEEPDDQFDWMKSRLRHIREEVDELDKAIEEKNIVEIVDALIDITYLTIGCMITRRWNFKMHWNAVHGSNMTKIKNDKGKIIKPSDWSSPNKLHKFILGIK